MTAVSVKRLLVFLDRWFDPVVVASVLEPLVADWQHEWRVATTPGQRAVADIRSVCALLSVIGRLTPAILFSPMPVPLAGAAVIRIGMFCAIGTLVLLAPFASQFGALGTRFFVVSSIYLVPQALGVLLPFALILIVDLVGLDRRLADHQRRRMLIQVTLLGMLTLLLLVGWATPYANQSWRDAVVHARGSAAPAARGNNELTLIELFRRQPMAVNAIWERVFLICLPMLLVVFRGIAIGLMRTNALSRMWVEIPWVVSTTAAMAWIQLCGYAFGLKMGIFPWMPMVWGIILTAALVMSALCNARAFRERSSAG
jgi:hypothetical protein